MTREVNAGHTALRRSERTTDPAPEKEYKLRVTRPHPSLDATVGEVWGHGSYEEMAELKRERLPDYPDEYDFKIVEK
jgi:hypothetical protein